MVYRDDTIMPPPYDAISEYPPMLWFRLELFHIINLLNGDEIVLESKYITVLFDYPTFENTTSNNVNACKEMDKTTTGKLYP